MVEAMDRRMALVTGATGGIGRAIAERLVEEDIFVVGISSTDKGAREFTADVGDRSRVAQGVKFNLSNTRAFPGWFDRNFSGNIPGIVVNAAGITNDHLLVRGIDSAGVADFERLLRINTVIPYILARKTAAAHRKTGGRTLNVTSVATDVFNPSQAEYVASKAALKAIGSVMSNEVGTGENKKLAFVNNFDVGPTNTQMWQKVPEDHRLEVEAQMVLHDGKPFSVEEVAVAALRILTGDQSEERGKVFHLNGGLWLPTGDPMDISLDTMPVAA